MGNRSAKDKIKYATVPTNVYTIVVANHSTVIGTIEKYYYLDHDGQLYLITELDINTGLIRIHYAKKRQIYVMVNNEQPSDELFMRHRDKIWELLNKPSLLGYYPSCESFKNGKPIYYRSEKTKTFVQV